MNKRFSFGLFPVWFKLFGKLNSFVAFVPAAQQLPTTATFLLLFFSFSFLISEFEQHAPRACLGKMETDVEIEDRQVVNWFVDSKRNESASCSP